MRQASKRVPAHATPRRSAIHDPNGNRNPLCPRRRSGSLELAAAVLLLAVLAPPPAAGQPDLLEVGRQPDAIVDLIDSDHLSRNGNLHTPTTVVGPNAKAGRDVVFLYFHGGLWFHQPMNPGQNPCTDGDNITVALIDPEDIKVPADAAVDDQDLSGYLYNVWWRMGRVSPCSSDTHAYRFDSTGQQLGQPGGSWVHSQPFTDGGFLTDFGGQAGKFMIMSRGGNASGKLPDTWLFRTRNWNARKAQWNAGIFPLIKIDDTVQSPGSPSILDQVGHVSPIILPPDPTATAVDGQGRRTVTWNGYFRWNANKMGRIVVAFSPDRWGPVTPTRVSIQDGSGLFRDLGPGGVLDFVPKKVHLELTGRFGTPIQIFQDGSQSYLLTREQNPHNNNYPRDRNLAPSVECKPVTATGLGDPALAGTPDFEDIYLEQRGASGQKIRIFPLFGPHAEGVAGELSSPFRTITGQMPTDYRVSMFGGGLLKIAGKTYFVTADRLDSVCSRLMCDNFTADGKANPFCGLDVSVSEVRWN